MEKRTSFGIITSYLLLIITAFADPVCAQHIQLENPSFEGTSSGKDKVPHGWFKASGTPDVQPGMFGITTHPSAGQHYVGMHSAVDQQEAIGQPLKDSLKAGLLYTMSFDLAYVPAYSYLTCYGNLAIFGGNTPGDSAELLWMSGMFTHETWKRYSATFTPSKSYKYISLWAYPTAPCNKSRVGIALLIDNVSPTIRQIVKTGLSSEPTCNNTNTGAAAIKITGGQAPYQYIWSPGNYKTDSISNVPAGIYQVTATAANGLIIKEQVEVQQSDLSAQAKVITSSCYNDNRSQITVSTAGGMPPYLYSLNGDTASAPVFDQLSPGAYTLIVKDQQVCADTFQLKVQPPPPLFAKLAITPTACGEADNGQLIPHVQGGAPPFEYRINNGTWQTDSLFDHLKAGSYQYEVKDQGLCSVSGTVEVTSPWSNCLVVMPSAFSPNGDGNNDVFRPKVYDNIRQYHIRVYNRWGAVIYEGNDPATGWDGTYKGAAQDPQTFIYICAYTDRNNERQEMKGTVTLVR